MMTNPFLSAARRRPARLILLALLIGVISFAFIGRAVEGLVVVGEIDRLKGFYQTVGSLRPLDNQDAYDLPEAADMLSNSEYLALEDRRRAVSGVLDGVYNSDISGLSSMGRVRYSAPYDYPPAIQAADVLFAGVLTEIEFDFGYGRYGGGYDGGYKLYFDIDTLLEGYPDYFSGGAKAVVWYPVGYPGEDFDVTGQLQTGGRYLIRAYFDRGLAPDDNRDQHLNAYKYLSLMRLAENGPFCLSLAPGETVDLSAPGLEGLREDMELVRANQHAMMVITTADMSAMPQTQPSARVYALEAGRWIDSGDNAGQSHVCVVSSDFARLRGLSVGDTLTMTLRDVKQPLYGYIPDEEIPYWRDYETLHVELEIAGIYSDVRLLTLPYPPYTFFSTILYIPQSLLPAGFGTDSPTAGGRLYEPWDYYSFTLRSPYDQEAFLEENREALAALGMEIIMAESGALNFLSSATPIRRSVVWGCLLFGLVLLLAILLASVLYIRYNRKDFALLRALGMPRGAAVRKMLVPIVAASCMAITVGGAFSWRYGLSKAAETLGAVQASEGGAMAASLSPAWLAVLCASVFAVLLALVQARAWALARRPVLEALQDMAGTKTKVRAAPTGVPRGAAQRGRDLQATHHTPDRTLSRSKGNQARAYIRFMLTGLWRGGVKTVLTLAVAAAFVLALGWMGRVIEGNTAEIERLYNTVTVSFELARATAAGGTARDENGNEANYIGQDAVHGILETGYVQRAELTAYVPWSAMTVPLPPDTDSELFYKKMEAETQVNLYGFSSIAAFQSNGLGLSIDDYAPGYDDGLFAEAWPRERLGSQYPPTEIPDDKWEHYRALLGRRATLWPLLDLSVPILLEGKLIDRWGLSLGDRVYLYRVKGDAYTIEVWLATAVVAGRYSDQLEHVSLDAEGTLRAMALLPLSALETLEKATKSGLGYGSARFTVDPRANRAFLEGQSALNEIINRSGTGDKAGMSLVPLNAVIWDSELRGVVEPLERNLQLMVALYPIAVALSALIATGLALLMMLQSAKKAAIMRVLGMPGAHARLVLCGEHILLVALGLLLGLTAAAITGWGAALTHVSLYLFGAVVGAAGGASRITRRRPLELLQLKE